MAAYTESRALIHTGDVLCIKGKSLFSSITRAVQAVGAWRNPALKPFVGVTHIGLATWRGKALNSAEMDGRHNIERRLSQHFASGAVIDVYRCPVSDETAVTETLDGPALDVPVVYGLWDLAKISIRVMTGIGTGGDTSADRVCSSWVMLMLITVGWKPGPWLRPLCCPAELALALHEQGLLKIEGMVNAQT